MQSESIGIVLEILYIELPQSVCYGNAIYFGRSARFFLKDRAGIEKEKKDKKPETEKNLSFKGWKWKYVHNQVENGLPWRKGKIYLSEVLGLK
jgi:hypothetical protein